MAAVCFAVAICGNAGAQSVPSPAGEAGLSHQVLKTLIETDTTHRSGSTTVLEGKIRTMLLDAGFPAADIVVDGPTENRGNLVVRYRAAHAVKKPLLIIIHLDVVEALRADWTMDPFVLQVKDGYFYGRGTQDVKGNAAAFLTAFLELQRSRWTPKRDVILALTADEEGGAHNGVAWLLEHRPELVQAEAVINPDMGGLLLRGGKPAEMAVEATEKTYADFLFRATNPGGHSSLPTPENALYEVADALGRLERAPFPVELNAITHAYYVEEQKLANPERAALIARLLQRGTEEQAAAELSAKYPWDNAILRTTCVATMMQAGHAPNALPGTASANVNCRILPGHSAEEVRKRLVAIADDPKVQVLYRAEDDSESATAPTRLTVAPPPPRKDIMDSLHVAMDALHWNVPVLPIMEAGASDSIYTANAGMPSYGFSGIGVESGDERAHGRDERILVSSYDQGVVFTRVLVKALGES
ncbi:MAG: M20/M25/M40 family metallo-hydrolase [Acidobacteriaceae bacterium]|nr:M20/M25/M40 family metallo-hydrolase [Acidobacteriaceae bacterium]